MGNKFEFMWQKEIPPSELNVMDYWELEEYVKLMNERNKEESEKREEHAKQQAEQAPKMPDMNKFSPGNFKIPNMPKY